MATKPHASTPSTTDIREAIAFGKFRGDLAFMNGYQRRAAFDRWLKQHDAELLASEEAKKAIPPPIKPEHDDTLPPPFDFDALETVSE